MNHLVVLVVAVEVVVDMVVEEDDDQEVEVEVPVVAKEVHPVPAHAAETDVSEVCPVHDLDRRDALLLPRNPHHREVDRDQNPSPNRDPNRDPDHDRNPDRNLHEVDLDLHPIRINIFWTVIIGPKRQCQLLET